ncbi:uncharacterized protein LOC128317650 [Pangasianodon hypophthalmus]|uniref:uncharacterized protein LOC128317650 n=1 Tax=Pangasianodon hypophthalmus TaxID=310915 RepID=UPI0023081254|nr:uncharacterized protein LOC128317650 [Pangasianodon hypophthalmus]
MLLTEVKDGDIKSRSHRSRVCCVLQSEEDLWSRSGDESQTRRRRHSLLRLCNTQDLLIKNVTEADLGLYYCALHETNISKDKNGVIISRDVYHYGNRSTRLSLLAEPCRSVCEPSVSELSVSWKLVFSVCVVCVLLSSLLSSICVYCLCTNTTKGTHTLALITNTVSALNTTGIKAAVGKSFVGQQHLHTTEISEFTSHHSAVEFWIVIGQKLLMNFL